MSNIKIYPATKSQAENIQTTVNEINSKVGGQLQVKTVMPSGVQQTVQADTGYTALSGVVVNPIAAAMPQTIEDYIMRNERTEPFSISVNGSIPEYACYKQTYLAAVYGELNAQIGQYAFYNCINLQLIDMQNIKQVQTNAFYECTTLPSINAKNLKVVGNNAFRGCRSIVSADVRNVKSFPDYLFYDCISLQYLDCRNLQGVAGATLTHTNVLKIIDLTNCDTPPIIRSEGFSTSSPDWKAVVKNDTVKSLFQSATNWSTYASHIYTVAEIETLYGDTYDNLYLQWFGHARNEVQA